MKPHLGFIGFAYTTVSVTLRHTRTRQMGQTASMTITLQIIINCLPEVYNRTSLSYFFWKDIYSRIIAHDITDSQGPEKSNHVWLIKDSWRRQRELCKACACNLKSDNNSIKMVEKQIKLQTHWQLFAGGCSFFFFYLFMALASDIVIWN